MADFNATIIDTFRSNNGVVREPVDFGDALVLVHVPTKDGGERVIPLAAPRTDAGWLIVASAAGSPKNPAWTYGLRRTPRTVIEVPGDPNQTLDVRVTELAGQERDEAWAHFVAQSPAFKEYEKTAEGRVFPIFLLSEPR